MNETTRKILHASASTEWRTPRGFFMYCNDRYGPFTLDAAATPENALCSKFYTLADDSLSQRWTGKVWLNPPYGHQVGVWVEKAYTSICQQAKLVCMLMPARTDTRWFHDWAKYAAEIVFIKGRLRFETLSPAPFPSMLLIFKQGVSDYPEFELLTLPDWARGSLHDSVERDT